MGAWTPDVTDLIDAETSEAVRRRGREAAMDTGRQAEELVSRCVSLVIYYRHSRKRRSDGAAMRADYAAIGEEARSRGLDARLIGAAILVELLLRYGDDKAYRLYNEFAESFGSSPRINPRIARAPVVGGRGRPLSPPGEPPEG